MKMSRFFLIGVAMFGFACASEQEQVASDPNVLGAFEEAQFAVSISCTAENKCSVGMGDCNNNNQCATGLVCTNDYGGRFGYPNPQFDVCLPATCSDGILNGEETTIDCDGGCGECPVCNQDPGGSDNCSKGCPCDEGQGDCDNNDQCSEGLICGFDLGVLYGQARTNDVCVVPHCANAQVDEDEVEVDCGGADCGACPTRAFPPGSLPYCSVAAPCTAGLGDCDNNAQCMPGLSCVLNVGASFGWAAEVDVCMQLL